MNKKDLQKLGIEDEDLVQKIIVLHGKDIEGIKATVETGQAEIITLQGQLTEAGTAIEGFKKLDVEGIQKAADDYKAQAEKAKNDAEIAIKKMKFDHTLEGALKDAKAKDIKSVRAHIDYEKIELDDETNTIKGLDKQLTTIKEGHSYLFDVDEKDPVIVIGAKQKSAVGDSVVIAARKAANLT